MNPADLRPRMTDAELEHVFDLPAGYMATASADVAQQLEQLRSWAEDLAEESAREFLYGTGGAEPNSQDGE